MSRRFQGGESSEILNQSSVKNEDMFQCRHEVGTVNDSDKAVPLSVIQSCPVATCETAGGTAAKVGVVNNFSDFTLLNGREVLVYFASGNTVDNPTFNLNNTGAFPLALENQLSTVSIGSGCWGDGVFLHLKYVDITVSNVRIQKWVICGHSIASKTSTQIVYADGSHNVNEVTSGNMQSVTSNAVKTRLSSYKYHANFLLDIRNVGIYTDICQDIIGAKEVLLVFESANSIYCDFRAGNHQVSFPFYIGGSDNAYYSQRGYGSVNIQEGRIGLVVESKGNGGEYAVLTQVFYNK